MAGAGNEVGKISIRVVPNLEDFHDDLKRQLAEEEKKRHKIGIGVDVDTSNIPREIKAAEKTVKDIEVGVDVDTANIASDVQKAAKDLKQEVKVDVDNEFANKALKELQANLDKVRASGKDISLFESAAKGLENKIRNVPVKPELVGGWEDDIRLELARMQSLSVDIDPKLGGGRKLESQLAGEMARLKTLASLRKIKVPVEVEVKTDKNRLSRGLASIGSALASGVAALGKTASAAGSGLSAMANGAKEAVTSIARLPEWLLLTAAVISILAPALSLLTGALVALPGVLTAIVVPAAAVALGMDGIKKAAEAAKPAFDKLKATMSETFQNGMTPAFQDLADNLFPRLQAALPKVADSLSNLFTTFTDTITTSGNLDKVEGTIRGIAAALDRAKPGVASFTNAFTSLVNSTAGPMLDSMVGTFNKLGTEFESWVNKVTANGQLQQAMDTLKGTLGEIGGALKDIAGWSFDTLADPAFGEKMKGFAADLRTIINELLPALKTGFEDVATVVSGLADNIKVVSGALGFLKDAGKVAFGSLEQKGQGANSIKDRLKSALGLGGEAAKAGEEAGKQASAGLNKGVEAGLESTKKTIESAISQGPQTVKVGGIEQGGVGIAVSGQVDMAISAARDKLVAFQGEFASLIAETLQPLEQIPSKLNTAFAGLGAAFAGAFGALKGVISENIAGIVNSIAVGFEGIPARLTTAFAGLGGAVAGAMIALKGVVAANAAGVADAFGQAFSGAAGRVAASLSGVSAAVSSAMSQAAGAVASGAGVIVQTMQAGLAAVVPVVEASFSAIAAVVTAKMAEAAAAVAAGGQQMVATALSFVGAMQAAGASVGAAFAQGIASQTGLVASAANALVGAARAFFPNSPADEGPFSGSGWVDASGEAVGKGFAKGMAGSQQEVVSTARELMQAVKDIFGSAEGLTLNFNMGPITQQTQRATAAVTEFGTAMSNIPLKQLDALQPALTTDPGVSRDGLSQQLDQLEIERKTLELQKSQAGADQAAIKARLEEIRQQKLQLGLQRDQLDYATKYGDQVDQSGSKMDQAYQDLTQSALKMPLDFVKATRQQFLSDIGISGGGALGAIMDYGLDFGSQFIFNVSNIDEAMAVQKNQVAKKAMGVVGR